MANTILTYHRTQVSFLDLTAPAREFKAVNNSISEVIQVMIDNQRILFSEVWDGAKHRANAKVREGQSTKWHTYVKTYIY